MNSSRTPNFVLNSVVYVTRRGDQSTLPEGAFVRPIELQYVPKHVTEQETNKYFNPEHEVYCYTRYGIIAISKQKLREV